MTRYNLTLCLLAILTLAFFSNSAWAVGGGSQVPDPGAFLQPNPNAKGTILIGRIGIFYTQSPVANTDCLAGPTVDLHIAVSAWSFSNKKMTTHSVGKTIGYKNNDPSPATPGFCYINVVPQRTAINNLIQTQLLPKFGLNSFELKSVESFTSDEGGDAASDTNPLFILIDVTLAAN